MLVKTINQFGRHIPSAGGHEGGEEPGPRRSPTPFPDGCVGSRGGQARPLWSKKAQLCVRVIIGERESGRPGSGSSLGLLSPTRRVCTSAESREGRPGQREKHKYIKQNADET